MREISMVIYNTGFGHIVGLLFTKNTELWFFDIASYRKSLKKYRNFQIELIYDNHKGFKKVLEHQKSRSQTNQWKTNKQNDLS